MDSLLGNSMAIAKLSMDAASLRHEAIASNIANVNTPGYVPLKVNFEEQLNALSENNEQNRLSEVKPFIEQESPSAGVTPQVALDMEVVKLNVNTLHFQSLVKLANKYISLLGTAINEGKR